MDPVLKYFNLGPEDIEQPRSNDSQSAKLWGVTLTIDPCIISLSSDPHALRSSMSCGHAITPNCLVAYIFSEIRKGKSTIVCPYADPQNPKKRCGYVWRYLELQKMAYLNKCERKYFEYLVSENKIKSEKNSYECSRCNNYTMHLLDRKKIVCRCCS